MGIIQPNRKIQMVNNYPIHPISSIRYRWLIMLLVLPASAYMILIQGPAADLSAVEIPMSLLIGPAISVSHSIPENPDQNQNQKAFALDDSPDRPPVDIAADMLDEHIENAGSIDEYTSDEYCMETLSMNDPFQIDHSFQIDDGFQTNNSYEISESFVSFETVMVTSPETLPAHPPEQTAPRVEQPGPEDPYIPIIMKAARKYKIDPAIIKAIIKAESGYNPKAVSKAGARGLMQLMPRTAKSLGVEDSFCPEQNILAGVRYFKQLLNQFNGDVKLALAAYNAGSRKVRKYKGIPPYRTTRIYIKKVFEYHKQYKQQILENG